MSNQSNGTDKNNETTTQLVAMLQEQMSINQALGIADVIYHPCGLLYQ